MTGTARQDGQAEVRRPGLAGRVADTGLGLGLVLSLGGCLLLLGGVGLFRLGVIDLDAGLFAARRWAMVVFGAALALSAIGFALAVIGRRQRAAIVGVLALVVSGTGFGWLYGQSGLLTSLPPIHDVQTDWTRPVAFSNGSLRARADLNAAPIRDDARIGEGNGRWSGMSFAAAQSVVYDQLKPLHVNVPPAEATVAVANAAQRLGWHVMLSDPPAGHVEAVSYSRWYGLGADVSVRVEAAEGGARIDVRSASRHPGPDMGANARRIKTLLDDVAFALRGG